MRRHFSLLAAIILAAMLVLLRQSIQAQSPATPNLPGAVSAAPTLYHLNDAFLEWPLPASDRAYGAIDGKHLFHYVVEQAGISRRYRDQGHPQFWGRTIGTSADAESAQWLADQFRRIGLADVRLQNFDLRPQWMPQSWEISVNGNGKTLHLEGTAEPAYDTPGTTPAGLDLEAVYVGTGSEADFMRRDVRGKAVFVYSMPLPGGTRPMATVEGALKRAQERGAAAIFSIVAQPGNMHTQFYPAGTTIPTFALGMEDGYAVRDLIGQSPGAPPHVHIRLDVKSVPGLKTATVWGTLPGSTDETIYVIAHRDGWFDAAGDNASGVATLLGLAEYYAKIPQARRRRTLIFLGTTGHHNSANMSMTDLIARRDELFKKTALFINAEHTSTLQTYLYSEHVRWANTYTAQFWYAGGPRRPELQNIAINAFREFGVSTYAEPDRAALPGDMSTIYRYVPAVTTSDFNTYFHTDLETPDVVPWTGLEATTRSYAKIIDDVNKLDLNALQREPEPEQPRPAPAPPGALAGIVPPAAAVYKLSDAFLEWPLPANDKAYGAIDGKHLHEYVVEQAAISRHYRDSGHPQFWGRIIGTSGDAESATWLIDRFKKIGLSDVHLQSFDLTPTWIPQSWEITAESVGKTLHLEDSAQPAYETPGTPPEGLNIEAVYVGTGSDADFAGRDVRGKAVFVFSMPLPGSMLRTSTAEGVYKRAQAKGAAAIFDIVALPGNMRNQFYPSGVDIPVFSLGMRDGYAMRQLIGEAPADHPPRVKIRLDVKRVPDLKTGIVWGTLPGRTAEKIYITAHRDGWFDASTDNGSGVATMLGLAEYYARIPQQQRRRTMIFLGLDGHHNIARAGRNWMLAHKDEVFENAALVINAEHTSTLQTYLYWEDIRRSNTFTAQMWYAGGPSRPKLQDIAVRAFREFGVPTYAEPELAPPPGDLGPFFHYAPGLATSDFNMFFHTDAETPETVPWTGLQATTRSYAKIIDQVNKLDLSDLKRPPDAPSSAVR